MDDQPLWYVIFDIRPVDYMILIAKQGIWISGIPITLDIISYSLGTYLFTIMVVDAGGNTNFHTITVKIIDEMSIATSIVTDTTITNTDTTITNTDTTITQSTGFQTTSSTVPGWTLATILLMISSVYVVTKRKSK